MSTVTSKEGPRLSGSVYYTLNQLIAVGDRSSAGFNLFAHFAEAQRAGCWSFGSGVGVEAVLHLHATVRAAFLVTLPVFQFSLRHRK